MRLRKHARTKLIRGIPLFADCSDSELAEVADLADEVEVAEGLELARQGHRGGVFIVIAAGSAEVRNGDEVLRTLVPGDFVGEIALMTGAPHSATVVATSPVHALAISESHFSQLLQDVPSIRAKLQRETFERLRGPEGAQPDSSGEPLQ
jgi:CRP/FNR family transcriptional regulator, cyclic AMP receptor protein